MLSRCWMGIQSIVPWLIAAMDLALNTISSSRLRRRRRRRRCLSSRFQIGIPSTVLAPMLLRERREATPLTTPTTTGTSR